MRHPEMASSGVRGDLDAVTRESMKRCMTSLRAGQGGEGVRRRLAAAVAARRELGLPVPEEVREQADPRLARLRAAEAEVAAYNRRRPAAR